MSRLCVLPLVWGFALLAGPPREIAGRVTDAQTGAAVPHARVRIIPSRNQSDEIVVLTGEDGVFDFTNVPEGSYQLSCERAGYLHGFQNLESQPVPSASEAKPVSVAIRLTPQAVIEGSVVDESGVVTPFANIQVYRRVAIEGRRQAQFVSQVEADDKGSFRIFDLAAGAYCIGVTISRAGMRRSKLAYPPVFYPNSPGITTAQFVELGPGQEEQIRIRLPAPVPAREIRGQIVPGGEGVSAQLRPVDSLAFGGPSGFEPNWDQKAHSFKFTGVPAGVYAIDVTAQVDGQQRRATTTVTVAGQDIVGIRLELLEPATLNGRVREEGQAAPLHPATNVVLRSSSYQVGAVVQADGSFEFRNLPPDTYRVVIFPPGGTSYLRSAWHAGRDVLHDGLTISGETTRAPLEITLGSYGGIVEGTVALQNAGQPDLIFVALLRRAGNAMVLEKQVSVTGPLRRRFILQGVPPGDYLLFAWPVDAQVEYAEPEFARQHDGVGKPVTVTEDAKVTVNIDRALFLKQP